MIYSISESMIGDVNIFYYDQEAQRKKGEIEIMIAGDTNRFNYL